MEISTNTAQSTNGYTQTTQKNNSLSNTSFAQYMNAQSQKYSQSKNTADSKEDYIEVSDTSKQTQTITYTQDVAKVQDDAYDPNKKFLNMLDKYMPNYFTENGISSEDEDAIRTALADNQISENEVRNLSFEQAQHLQKLKFDLMDYGEENNVPVIWMAGETSNVQYILNTTNFTKDDTFNKSIFKTFADDTSLDSNAMSKILEELSYTLKQAYSDMELGFNINQSSVPFGLLHEFENSEIDYESHLLKLRDHLDILLSKPNDSDVRKQYKQLNENCGKILENYQDFKK